MAITTCLTNQFKLDVLKGGLRFGPGSGSPDTFKVALYTSSATWLDATAIAYAATNEISGTGYSVGGTPVVPTLSGPGATTFIDFSDAQWTSATFTARAMLLYRSGAGSAPNGTQSDCAIGIWDFASDKSVSAGTFTIVMPAADASNALIRLT